MKFTDESLKEIGSTELGRSILAAAVPDLEQDIRSISNWRKDYLAAFRAVAKAEHRNKNSAFEVASNGLKKFEQSVRTDSGELLIDVISESWRKAKDQVAMVVIRGTGEFKHSEINAEDYVSQHLAEPLVAERTKKLDYSKIDQHLLIALAGGAEYSPARTWLDWGGTVAIVARPRKELWLELIARARSSAGTLYVPVLRSRVSDKDVQTFTDDQLAEVAGLDLIEDTEAIAGWLSMLARTETRSIVLGSYAYAPGVKHLQVQACQHVLARVLTEALPKSRVTLTWLATPTDSYVVNRDVLDDIEDCFAQRSPIIKLRDSLFCLKPNKPEVFRNETGGELVVIDSTSSLQGPSYALAKRLQRWLAYQQVYAGRNVAYLVSPPAKTHSVLDTRILRATYKGAPKFGLVPFEVKAAVDLSAALLLAELNEPRAQKPMSSYLDLAVHGGLWRLIYSPSGVWRASTLRGILGYFK